MFNRVLNTPLTWSYDGTKGKDVEPLKYFFIDGQKFSAYFGRCAAKPYVMLCAIWYQFRNLEKLKPATFLKLSLLHECFSRFLNCTNGTNSRETSHMILFIVILSELF